MNCPTEVASRARSPPNKASDGDTGQAMGEGRPDMAGIGEKFIGMRVGSYLADNRSDARLADPRISPIHAAAKLPPSHIVCGANDPLSEQAHTLADALKNAGVTYEKVIVGGMPHGFVQMEFFPQARERIDQMVAFLAKQLA